MAHSDWIPAREQDLVDLAEKCTATAGKITAFLTARSVYETDDSTEKRLAKGEAKKDAVSAGDIHCARLRSSFSIAKSDLESELRV